MPRSKPVDRPRLKAVARRVHEARTARGLTREQLAETLEIEPDTLWRYESARLPISLSMLYRIAGALGVPVEAFLREAGPSSEESALLAAYRLLSEDERRAVLLLVTRLGIPGLAGMHRD